MRRSCRLSNRRVRNQELGLARVKKFFNHFVHKDQLNDFWIKKIFFTRMPAYEPEKEIVASLERSKGGAHFAQIPWQQGYNIPSASP